MNKVRTRFAPSPTGYLHVGGIRTALFAWLVARQNKGQFILRLEDTDKAREVEGSGQHIIDCLNALGLDYDEGPVYQSRRLDLYKEWAQKLIDSGRAYADPFSPQEVQAFREQAQKTKKAFLYRDFVSDEQRNNNQWDGKVPLRFKSEPKAYEWRDEIMGDLKTGPEVVDDFILVKSDGYPTYNFAHIVDDADMNISYVIRGQEFLPSMPNYLNLYEALGLKPPLMATVPHILNDQGNKKLSKRDGAKDILDYIKEGFLPEALISFIATLGWNDGTEQEIFTRDELIKKFNLTRVQKSGARFDEQRLLWVNGHFIREQQLDDLYKKVADFWPKAAKDYDDTYKNQVLSLVQERLKYFAELPELSNFFFEDLPVDLSLIENHKQLKKLSREDLLELINTTREALNKSSFTENDLTDQLNGLLDTTGTKPAVLFSLIRIVTTWSPASPGLAGTLHVLGKQKTLQRLEVAYDTLKQ